MGSPLMSAIFGIQFAGSVPAPTFGGVLGQLADFFRLWWGLVYWNTRKSWFQLRRGRSPCPCQSPSDSGRAYETHCEACTLWAKPARFRRVCPLLVETKEGLRCSADTAQVRPFWGRALGYYGSAALGVYLAGVLAVFVFLRTIGYPVSILHVGLPPLWHRVGQARSWFFHDRATKAFAEGKTAEGLLYLANAYEFDPQNYTAGISLAKNFQAGQPARSDHVFEKLMRDHPDKRSATAQDWFRALLARGSFEKIVPLARGELLTSAAHGGVWLRALLFATRQTGNDAPLRDVLEQSSPLTLPWRPVIETELLLRAGRTAEARAAIERPWAEDAPAFTVFYRVQALLELREPLRAVDLLEQHRGRLDGEARATLLLDIYAQLGSRHLQQHVERILAPRLNAPTAKTLCAHLIRHPNPQIFQQLWQKLTRETLPLDSDTAGAWFSLLCAAGAVGDRDRLHDLTTRLKHASNTPFVALSLVEAFFRGETAERRITTFLPILPLPLDVTYALIERYAPPVAATPATAKRA